MARLYFSLQYEGKEIDTWEISRYVGNIIPENFDPSKFQVIVGDNMLIGETIKQEKE